MAANKDTGDVHVFVTVIILAVGLLFLLSLPYNDCALHEHFVGAECICKGRKDGQASEDIQTEAEV